VEAVSENLPLITKYRPTALDEMLGHELQLAGLNRALTGSTVPHSYLFTGIAGLGKTTLARIVGSMLECDVLEIDAASYNSVDSMRQLVEMANHMSLTGNGRRMFLIDECHTLSKAAWQALLKVLEEPPEFVYFALCTTEAEKVPETIKTRCYHTALKPLRAEELGILLDTIAELEGWQVAPDVMSAVIQAATGQPRKALSMLESVHNLDSREEVKRVLTLQMQDGDPMYDFAVQLVNGKGWPVLAPILAKLEDEDFENVNIMVGRFLISNMARAKDETGAKRAWKILEALMFPAATYDRKAAFYAAVGRALWA
jgi:DNA polymerase III gamma/tau subunit